MSALIVIPARFASSRLPGKPLLEVKGAEGELKPLLQWTWEIAVSVANADRVVIATDDVRIQQTAETFGAEVIMTSSQCRNGTERCAQVMDLLDVSYEVVVNLQGDAMMTPAKALENLINALENTTDFDVATPFVRLNGAGLACLLNDRDSDLRGATTVVCDKTGHALYFSKEIIPRLQRFYAESEVTPVCQHLGVYGYRTQILSRYVDWSVGELEEQEGLEQLRFLENDVQIQCLEVDLSKNLLWEVNNPHDIAEIEFRLKKLT